MCISIKKGGNKIMLQVKETNGYKKDYKLSFKRGFNLNAIDTIVETLVREQPLPQRCEDHPLKGSWKGCRDCHIEPDWVLIYRVEAGFLYLIRTGTHSDLEI